MDLHVPLAISDIEKVQPGRHGIQKVREFQFTFESSPTRPESFDNPIVFLTRKFFQPLPNRL
jgi:hypothetical protein